MQERIVIQQERPDQAEVVELLAELDRYLASLYPPEANHILDLQALLAPEVSFFVARDGQQIVGTGALRRMQGQASTGGQPYGEIKRMYVDPARRGEGIGVQLLLALEHCLRAQGYGIALLETGAAQTEAVRLYERCGYAARGVFGAYADNGLSVYYGKTL